MIQDIPAIDDAGSAAVDTAVKSHIQNIIPHFRKRTPGIEKCQISLRLRLLDCRSGTVRYGKGPMA
jgi:hypothetical protein